MLCLCVASGSLGHE
ncbi:MAG: hypothetical protein ACPGQM_08795 [Alphaproteobacteria bacterium]